MQFNMCRTESFTIDAYELQARGQLPRTYRISRQVDAGRPQFLVTHLSATERVSAFAGVGKHYAVRRG